MFFAKSTEIRPFELLDVIDEINGTRQELNRMERSFAAVNEDLLRLSEKLDKLIVRYYEIKRVL
ncbi:aspartyl-phosphate phosphatase Spo0E family protein [Paenibacillus sp. UNC496MF]|uniref:aspartyl-phosphate phosphatase Spo0E family protein n=1 Tax=Paenibacillus sp. UNC496MF TaxID=1502753 RepID=UPI001C43660E|nr:aspartyl-phosphate phosphatase Spo0E family protein [Paenibacillus sp. UNC496MF]